jgi:hypothetical protein
MTVGGVGPVATAALWRAYAGQSVQQVGAHQSSPTSLPVRPVDPVSEDLLARRPSGHTLDIRV